MKLLPCSCSDYSSQEVWFLHFCWSRLSMVCWRIHPAVWASLILRWDWRTQYVFNPLTPGFPKNGVKHPRCLFLTVISWQFTAQLSVVCNMAPNMLSRLDFCVLYQLNIINIFWHEKWWRSQVVQVCGLTVASLGDQWVKDTFSKC